MGDGALKEKIAHGVALRLSGDEAGFIRVDDEIQSDPVMRSKPAALKYHALRLAACGAALVLAGCSEDVFSSPKSVYAGPPPTPASKQAPPCDVYAGPPERPIEKKPQSNPQPPKPSAARTLTPAGGAATSSQGK